MLATQTYVIQPLYSSLYVSWLFYMKKFSCFPDLRHTQKVPWNSKNGCFDNASKTIFCRVFNSFFTSIWVVFHVFCRNFKSCFQTLGSVSKERYCTYDYQGGIILIPNLLTPYWINRINPIKGLDWINLYRYTRIFPVGFKPPFFTFFAGFCSKFWCSLIFSCQIFVRSDWCLFQ